MAAALAGITSFPRCAVDACRAANGNGARIEGVRHRDHCWACCAARHPEICSLLYGAFEAMSCRVISPAGIRDIVGFTIMIMALYVRPEGIFGRRQEERA